MNRIESIFNELKNQNRQALIPFITCGDPNLDTTLATMTKMVEKGANIIELGVPFSDPMADGPVIQLANERSLENNTSLTDVINLVARFRKQDNKTGIVLMGYLNPIEYMGYETFVARAKTAGVDGLITVDLPPEEAEVFDGLLAKENIAPIYLLTPTTSSARATKILEKCKGYIYYVSLKGVTGSNQLNVQDVSEQLGRLRQLTQLPIAVGFGIRDAETAGEISNIADGVVVGSVLVNKMAELTRQPEDEIATEVALIIQGMRESMDQHC